MKKVYIVLALLAGGLFLAGCTTEVTYTPVTQERFTVDKPDTLNEFEVSEGTFEIAYFSDDTAETFMEGALSVYVYPEIYLEDYGFDQEYCDLTYELIADPASIAGFSGINKASVSFVDATDQKPAYCDISYELFNEDTEAYVAKQMHRQYLFLDGADEVVVEVATTQDSFPDYLITALDSFEVIPQNSGEVVEDSATE